MKIISKYKDYYDYLVGSKYGIDEKVVLDRREGFVYEDFYSVSNKALGPKQYEKIYLAICDKLYTGIYDKNGKFYWNEQIKDAPGVIKEKRSWYSRNKESDYYIINDSFDRWSRETISISIKDIDLNTKEGCPIIYTKQFRGQFENAQNFPMLSNLKFASLMGPEEIYIEIYNWMSKRNEFNHVDKRTDVQKLESKGFDKKTSFRH